MKIYIMSGANYSEDGDLMSYARVFKDLESAKAALKADFEENSRRDVGTKDEWIDDEADISESGMVWWSYGTTNQTHCEIIVADLE
jgi:hypothetical protein